jgi:hypothetical protein
VQQQSNGENQASRKAFACAAVAGWVRRAAKWSIESLEITAILTGSSIQLSLSAGCCLAVDFKDDIYIW